MDSPQIVSMWKVIMSCQRALLGSKPEIALEISSLLNTMPDSFLHW